MKANIERAIKLSNYKWDSNDFLKQETIYTKDFSYLELATGTSTLVQIYNAINFFMRDGHRPIDIHSNTIRYLDCFGIDGFVEQDVSLLLNWALTVLDFGNKIQHTFAQKSHLKDWHLFEDLLKLCTLIIKRFKLKQT